jgi:hypothetical protein
LYTLRGLLCIFILGLITYPEYPVSKQCRISCTYLHLRV